MALKPRMVGLTQPQGHCWPFAVTDVANRFHPTNEIRKLPNFFELSIVRGTDLSTGD